MDNYAAIKTNDNRDFPDGPVTKTLCPSAGGPGFDPWSGN